MKKQTKTVMVSFRLTAKDVERVEKAAKENDRTRADFIRLTVLRAIEQGGNNLPLAM